MNQDRCGWAFQKARKIKVKCLVLGIFPTTKPIELNTLSIISRLSQI